jgi:serine O-acetyltransferase
VARIVSELANECTGIDIHPRATIGPGFLIGHGHRRDFGEKAVVGALARLHQHVTFGGRGQRPSGQEPARGPHGEREARRSILGRARIGNATVRGGNVWLLRDGSPNRVVL